ncbi:MAG: chromosomal replication initiator protein DnaA [Alphaproteobacteria bacterium]
MLDIIKNDELNNRWRRILSYLHSEFGNTAYDSWLKKLDVKSINEDSTLIISCLNSLHEKWIRRNYLDRIQELWLKEDIGILHVKLVIADSSIHTNDLEDTPISETDLADNLQLDPKFTFNNFVVNETNRMAFQASQKMADGSGMFNPLFICGKVGLGKTHLLHAIATHVKKNNPEKKILYLSAEKFVSRFINAIRNEDMTQFKNEMRSVDILLMDDIQFISGKSSTQEEFFHTFNDLINHGCQIILSSSVPPAFLENFDERITSRLMGGIVAEINKTDYELRCQILQNKAKNMDCTLEQNVVEYLAGQISSNVRELEGALNRIVAYSSIMDVDINVSMIPQVLHDLLEKSKRQINIDDIKKVVADYFKVQLKDLNSNRRSRDIARPRQIAIWLSKELTQFSLPEIGRKFDRDHTTIMHAIKRIDELVANNNKVSEDITTLKRHLNG